MDFVDICFGSDALKVFVQRLRRDSLVYLDEIEEESIPLQFSLEYEVKMKQTDKCPMRLGPFTAKGYRERHHNHDHHHVHHTSSSCCQ